MTITLNVQNEQLFDKILWFLNRFKNDGLEIIANRNRKKELPSAFFNPIKIEKSDFISRVTQNPREISIDTKFLSRDEANER